jgi:hypothetical protein
LHVSPAESFPADTSQCDQKPDGCTQCANARRQCPGYRKLGDVVFKDESVKIVRKFQAKEVRNNERLPVRVKAAGSSCESMLDADDCLEVVYSDTTVLPAYALAPTIEERATAFFLKNYIMTADGPAIGHMTILYRLKGTLPESLLAGMKAVGIAGYAHAVYAPSLMKHARYQYVQALRATNETLRNPNLAVKDSTLISILILSIYEAVTGKTEKSIKAWSDHINGASALLKLRGRQQIESIDGRQLFLQTVGTLMVTSIQQNIPLPDYIIEWTREAREESGFPNPGLTCQEIMMEFTEYNAQITNGTLSDPDAIITRGLELDNLLKEAFENVPDGWEYETVVTEAEPELIYNGRYHVYWDVWCAQIWNGMRSFRCLFHEQIQKTIQEGHFAHPPRLTDSFHTAQLQKSIDTMCSLQADILATVPQHLGFVSRDQRYPPPPSPSGPWKPARLPEVSSSRMTGPYFILWPLWYAGIMAVATDATRRYVSRTLTLIAEELGIQQAGVLADVLADKHKISFR